jgi:outer membrane putative beta-barrel porin/alpha-amylase
MAERIRTFVSIALASAFAYSAHSAPCGAGTQNPISTDRPQFTEASTVVPCASLQFENGFAETGEASQHGLDLPETWMRLGIPAKGEIRFAFPEYFSNTDTANGFASGASDIVLGYKQQIGPTHGFDVSIIPSLSFPTGSSKISSHGYDPFVQVPWSRSLSKNWTAAGMFALMDPTQPRGRNVTGQGTLYFDRQLTALIDAWAEYSGAFPQRGGPTNILNLGACYKPTPRQQIDFHWTYGLSAAAPDYSVGLGYSVRIQDFRAKGVTTSR